MAKGVGWVFKDKQKMTCLFSLRQTEHRSHLVSSKSLAKAISDNMKCFCETKHKHFRAKCEKSSSELLDNALVLILITWPWLGFVSRLVICRLLSGTTFRQISSGANASGQSWSTAAFLRPETDLQWALGIEVGCFEIYIFCTLTQVSLLDVSDLARWVGPSLDLGLNLVTFKKSSKQKDIRISAQLCVQALSIKWHYFPFLTCVYLYFSGKIVQAYSKFFKHTEIW